MSHVLLQGGLSDIVSEFQSPLEARLHQTWQPRCDDPHTVTAPTVVCQEIVPEFGH